jgi:hypothetical protein
MHHTHRTNRVEVAQGFLLPSIKLDLTLRCFLLSGRRFAKCALFASVFVLMVIVFEDCYRTQPVPVPIQEADL